MTGVAGAIAGLSQNKIFAPGLFRKLYFGYAGTDTTYFDSQSPYSSSVDGAPANQSWSNGSSSGLWLGYYRPLTTANTTFSLQISGYEYDNYNYLWLGSPAVSGYNAGNALISGGPNSFGSTSLLAGVTYPLRIQVGYYDSSGFFSSSSFSFTLLVNGSTAYTIFYNSLTSGI